MGRESARSPPEGRARFADASATGGLSGARAKSGGQLGDRLRACGAKIRRFRSSADVSRHGEFAGGSWDAHSRTEFSLPLDIYARFPATHASGAVTPLPARKGNSYQKPPELKLNCRRARKPAATWIYLKREKTAPMTNIVNPFSSGPSHDLVRFSPGDWPSK